MLFLTSASSLCAATKKWSGAGGTSDWITGTNWIPANVPTTSDDILLDNSIVSLPTSMIVNGGDVEAETLTFEAGFNPSSTTLIGGAGTHASFLTIGGTGTGANPLIKVNSTAGTITFDRRNGGSADLSIVLGATSSISVNAGATLAINCDMSGAFGFTKTGTGMLRLAGTNTYTGDTIVSQGTLALTNIGATICSISNTPSITVNSGALLDVSGVVFSLQASQILAGSGAVRGDVTALAGATLLAGPAGSAGTLMLSNNLTLNGATLVFDLANSTTEGGGINDEILVSGNLTLSGNNIIALNYLNGSLPAGTYKILKYTGAKTGSFALGASYPNVTLDQTTTPNYVTLVVGSPGSTIPNLTWKGDGANNIWDMATTANWLNGASASVYYDPANVTFDNSGSTTPAINLKTTVTPKSLTVNSGNNYTIGGNGRIGSLPGLTNALTKSGSGTLTLNTTNDFAGGVSIQAGTIKAGNPFAIPSGSGKGDTSVAGVLDLNGNSVTLNGFSGSGTVDNTSGSLINTLTIGANNGTGVFSGVIKNTSGTVALTKTGSGTITLSGNNTFAGATAINDGGVRISHGNALGATAGNTSISGGTTLACLELTGGITVSEPLVLAMKFGVGSGTADPQVPHIENISGINTLSGPLTLNSGGTYWTFQSDGGKLILAQGLSSAASGGRPILLQGAGDGEIQGAIQNGSGFVALVKSGGGTWTLSGSNSFSQGVTVNAGTLRLGNGNAIPSGAGKGDISVNGTLDLNATGITINGLLGSGAVDNSGATPCVLTVGSNNSVGTFSGIIQNTGAALGLSKVGTGVLTLSGNNSYSGSTLIGAGILKAGSANALPNGAGKGDVTANGTLDLNGNNVSINGLLGSGTVDNLSGSLTYLLTVGGNNSGGTFSGVIQNTSGTIGLSKIGAGTLTLSAANLYSGNTTINAGTLLVNGSLGNGMVTVGSSGTLGGGGTVAGPVTVQSGGTLSPGSSIGTLTINNSLALSGATVMEINKTGATLSSDLVKGVTTLTYGGTLTVTATGDALAENDSFNLFDATTFAGSFSAINLPSLSCLAWDTSKLAVDGTIRVTHDTVPPVFGAITATEVQSGTVNVKNCAASVVPGTVNLSVAASDNCALAGPPVVALTNGANTATAAFVNESPSGTFNYTWVVTSGTPTGTWTGTATATDTLGNTARTTFTLCVVQQFQVTGQVEMQSFAGTNRTVTFVATSSANTPLQTNDVVLTFTGSPVKLASYTINVPVNTANLSAKTAWTLRKKLAVTFSSGQAVLNFSSATRLLGGEITQDNRVNTTDNNIFKSFNGKLVSTTPAAAQADVNGDGRVNTSDYNILKSNLGKVGDAQ